MKQTLTPLTEASSQLQRLVDRIVLRVEAVVVERSDWPCRKGCDACCRSLGEIPHATIAEWERLREGVRMLPESVQAEIQMRIERLAAASESQPVVCPFLDCAAGACLVYDHRMLACRAYGFFVSRGEGRWCRRIEEMPEAYKEGVLFGNFDAVLEEVVRLYGDTVPLTAWWFETPSTL